MTQLHHICIWWDSWIINGIVFCL